MPLHIPPLDVLSNPKQHMEQKEKPSSKSHRLESKHSQQSSSKTKESRGDGRTSESKEKSPKKDDRSSVKCSKSVTSCDESQFRTRDQCGTISANLHSSSDSSVKHTCSNLQQIQTHNRGSVNIVSSVEDKGVPSKPRSSDQTLDVSSEPIQTKLEVSYKCLVGISCE